MNPESPFAHRVARPAAKPAEPKPARAESPAPFAHTASKKQPDTAKFALEPMPLSDDDMVCEDDMDFDVAPSRKPGRPETIAPFPMRTASKFALEPMPLSEADMVCEDDPEDTSARPATISPSASQKSAATVPHVKESAMRQWFIALIAFAVTVAVILVAVIAFKAAFSSR